MEKRTELGEIGEFGLIERLGKHFKKLKHGSSLTGIGDDAAVIDANDKEAIILTSDMLLEGIHFDLSYMPLPHLGYKSIAVNISDIAAMNAFPEQVTVNIGLSNRFSVEAVEALYEGIEAACKQYNIDLVGGDTTSSGAGLVISVTAIGRSLKEKLAYRKGARPGDIICVTGDLGAAYIGLQILEREKQEFLANPKMQPKLEKHQYLVGRQLRPEARMDVVHELREKNLIPTSMIDISDGLASELLHISKNSEVGMKVYEDKLPLDKMTYDNAVEFKIGPTTAAMNGGEDYELLFTISQKDFEDLKKHPDIHFIGYVQEEKENVLISKEGNVHKIQAQGWKAF